MPPRKRKAEDGSAPSKGKKKKTDASEKKITSALVQDTSPPTPPPLAPSQFENEISTEDKAMLSLPPELINEILKCYPEIVVGTPKIADHLPVLGTEYLERNRALRSLSQVSKAYRNAFLPLLWETINICCCCKEEKSFYKNLGDTMIRYATGLEECPALKPFIRSANLVFTRYKASEVLPVFARCLESLPNLRNMHIIHAHTQMTTALKTGFEDVTLSNIRSIIGPGNCHEILKRCPNVETVWSTVGDGSTLIGVMRKHCPNVQELRGFYFDENAMKRITKATPNLRILDTFGESAELIIKYIPSFKLFHTIIGRMDLKYSDDSNTKDKAFIQAFKAVFKKLPAIAQRRRIRLYKEDRSSRWERGGDPPLPSFYQEVDMDE